VRRTRAYPENNNKTAHSSLNNKTGPGRGVVTNLPPQVSKLKYALNLNNKTMGLSNLNNNMGGSGQSAIPKWHTQVSTTKLALSKSNKKIGALNLNNNTVCQIPTPKGQLRYQE
jgi:hypothetical protein